MRMRSGLWLLIAIAIAACDEEEALPPASVCPNELPVDGADCPEPGLICNYFTGCGPYFPATCEGDGRWSFEDGCAAMVGGAGGMPSTASTTSSTTTSTSTSTTSAGMGGMGGAGGLGGGF